jgi:hypothetical protein
MGSNTSNTIMQEFKDLSKKKLNRSRLVKIFCANAVSTVHCNFG